MSIKNNPLFDYLEPTTFIGALKRIKQVFPAMRCGQIIANAIPESNKHITNIYYLDDVEFTKLLNTYYHKCVEQTRKPPFGENPVSP